MVTALFFCPYPLLGRYFLSSASDSGFILLIPPLLTQDGWHGGDGCKTPAAGGKDPELRLSPVFFYAQFPPLSFWSRQEFGRSDVKIECDGKRSGKFFIERWTLPLSLLVIHPSYCRKQRDQAETSEGPSHQHLTGTAHLSPAPPESGHDSQHVAELLASSAKAEFYAHAGVRRCIPCFPRSSPSTRVAQPRRRRRWGGRVTFPKPGGCNQELCAEV